MAGIFLLLNRSRKAEGYRFYLNHCSTNICMVVITIIFSKLLSLSESLLVWEVWRRRNGLNFFWLLLLGDVNNYICDISMLIFIRNWLIYWNTYIHSHYTFQFLCKLQCLIWFFFFVYLFIYFLVEEQMGSKLWLIYMFNNLRLEILCIIILRICALLLSIYQFQLMNSTEEIFWELHGKLVTVPLKEWKYKILGVMI